MFVIVYLAKVPWIYVKSLSPSRAVPTEVQPATTPAPDAGSETMYLCLRVTFGPTGLNN